MTSFFPNTDNLIHDLLEGKQLSVVFPKAQNRRDSKGHGKQVSGTHHRKKRRFFGGSLTKNLFLMRGFEEPFL